MFTAPLDEKLVAEALECLKRAAGEIEYSIELAAREASAADLQAYKRMAGKVIIAIYSGLAGPLLEGHPSLKAETYKE